MWLRFVPLALIGACMAPAPGRYAEPAARVAYGDLTFKAPAGRAELHQRVEAAARQFCRRHGKDVTPGELRLDASYCLEMLRASIVDAMPREIRKYYGLARREAGMRRRRR
ncbi:UrcA family protein [Sphingomonas sp. JC676]|uniref:UrcA family protein n=1 Tax=Sphingomonas sp. JC676 TaxID=2768065 RepID=UPI0016581623|nr:UrcA family protein [Sphingomonas sp. JC676]MBC9034391.1 UrcA family protein [Sphingomonas sp. JC676]